MTSYDDFLVARNPDGDSTLPYLLRLPLGPRCVVVKARDTWPRTSKVYCHRVEAWPDDADVVERVPVRSCVRRGAAIELVVDRARESRSQFVITTTRGREAVFWPTARTRRQARPAVEAVVEPVVVVAPRDRPPHAVVREWAAREGIVVSPRGRVSSQVVAAYLAARDDRETSGRTSSSSPSQARRARWSSSPDQKVPGS